MPYEYILYAPVALVIFLLTIGLSIWALLNEDFKDKLLLIPYDMIMYKEYWRLLSSGFIHGNPLHLSMNIVSFYFFAFILEHRIGHWQFLVLYILGMLISNVATTIRYKNDTSFEGSLGASGAISAIILSAVIVNPYLNFGLPILTDLFPILQLPGYIIAIIFLIYSLINSFRTTQMQINHVAHFWGAFSGILLTFMIKPKVVDIIHGFITMM
ncbi:MAG: rhomboid family intramembrane serine protease [Bacteroidota bacterium]